MGGKITKMALEYNKIMASDMRKIEVGRYNSPSEAGHELGIGPTNVSRSLYHGVMAMGYFFSRFKDCKPCCGEGVVGEGLIKTTCTTCKGEGIIHLIVADHQD